MKEESVTLFAGFPRPQDEVERVKLALFLARLSEYTETAELAKDNALQV